MRAYSTTSQAFTPERLWNQSARLDQPSRKFEITNADPTLANELAVRSEPQLRQRRHVSKTNGNMEPR